MAVSFEIISAGLNAGLATTVAQVATFLATQNPISLVGVEKKFSNKGQQLKLLISYKSGGATYIAQGFQKDATGTANAKALTYFAANTDFRIKKIVDVSNPYRRSLNNDAVIVFGVADYSPDLFLNQPLLIASADANINGGASGTATIMTAAGATGATITVRNRTSTPWAAGDLGYVAVEPVTGAYQGFPSCC